MISDHNFPDDFSESSPQSDTVEISKAIAENTQLREINIQLKSNLENLQNQFDEAVGVFQKMDTVNKENINLKQQLLKSKEEIDDLNKRLQIIMQNSSEINSNVQNTRAVSDREHQEEIAELQAQIFDLQNKNKLEIERNKTKLRNLEDISIKAQTENSVIKNQLGKIFNLSQNYFHQKFNDPNDLIDYLMHPVPEFERPIRTEDNSEDRKKIRLLKEKLEKEKVRRKQLELEIIQIKKAAEVEASKQTSEKTDIEDIRRNYENQIKKQNAEHQREIVNLMQKMKAKRLHNSGTQTIPEFSVETSPLLDETTKESELLKSQLRETQNSLTQLQTQTTAFQAQINDEEKMKEKMRKKLQEARLKNEQLTKELKEAQKYIAMLNNQIEQENDSKAVNDDKMQLLKATKDDLQSKLDLLSSENERYKKSIEYLEELTSNQSTELEHITHDRDYLLSLVHTQNNGLLQTEIFIQKLQKQLKETEYLTNGFDRPEPQKAPSEWDFGTLPEDLKDILREFANNEGMDIDNRIKHIFGIVSKWFDNSISDHEGQIQEMNQKVEDANKTIANFATSILRAIEQDSLDLNEIVAAVNDLHKEKLTLEQKLNELNAAPVYFTQQTYNEMNDTINSLQEIAKDLRNKEKQKKAELHECKAAFIECQQQNQEQIDTLQAANEKAYQTINELQQQLDDLHGQHKRILNELTSMKDVHSSEYNQAQSEIEAIRSELAVQLEDEKTIHIRQLHECDEKIAALSNQNRELNSSLKQWEEISRKSTDEARKLRKELNAIQLNKDEQISKIVQQKDNEIQQIEDHYQTMIEQLREKSNETESIVKEMQTEFEENEKKMRELNSQVTQLTFELQKADLKSQSQLDSVERSKKLIVAQLKTQLMAVETKYSVLAEEQKHNWENEKRELFGYIAQQFGAFFDAKQTLNEDSFKQVVSKIKNEIERHKKQEITIRRLLKAKENQTTEDALADLVLSNHPRLQKKTNRY